MHAAGHAAVLAAALLCAGQAWAQNDAVVPDAATPIAAAAPEVVAESPTTFRIPAGTTVTLELVDALSSRTNQTGDTFALRLSEPIMEGERVLVPAGALGGGEVIDASQGDMGGEQGKLILSGRFLELGGQRVRIRGLTLGSLARSRVDAAVGLTFVPYVGVLGGFLQGGEIDMPAGTLAQARLAAEVVLPNEEAAAVGAEPPAQ